jgi:long-chain acyl-CoA synthetase
VPDDEYGEALAAVVEPAAGAPLSADAVRSYLRDGSRATRCRDSCNCAPNCRREDSGKIFKRKLRDPYWDKAGQRI